MIGNIADPPFVPVDYGALVACAHEEENEEGPCQEPTTKV